MKPEEIDAVTLLEQRGYTVKSPNDKKNDEEGIKYILIGLSVGFVLFGHINLFVYLSLVFIITGIPFFFLTLFKKEERKKALNWYYIMLIVATIISFARCQQWM